MPQSERPTYPLNQSPFFKLASRSKLAKLLFLSPTGLKRLTDSVPAYRCWDEAKKSGGTRRIEAPPEALKVVQRRISDLLQRISPPAYLMAPVKRRSYVDNAAMHVGSRAFRLLDVEDFFPSCTDKRVFWFFHKQLQCSLDVASIIARLATFNRHLPQGSPCSPTLAFFAYCDMWGEIGEIVSRSGCKLSIYADDITISGDTVFERDIWSIKLALHRAGHQYSQRKERSVVNRPADITGVIVTSERLLLPNRQHLKLAVARKGRQLAKTDEERVAFERRIRGRIAQAGQITKHLNQTRT